MRTTVKGKNLDVLDRDRKYAEQKLQRIARLVDEQSDVTVEFSVEHNRNADETHIAELTVLDNGHVIRGVGKASTFRAAMDEAVDKADRQTVVQKERPRDRGRPTEAKTILRSLADGTQAPDTREGHPAVVKVKRFAIEPMFEEDAVARMEELGHEFFLFVNAENERLALLYRRRDGDYGLIEPTIGGAYTPGRK